MNISILFISASIAVGLLIIHSYFLRGRRVTLNFFVFAFMWAFYKEGGTPPVAYSYLKLYEFLNKNVSLLIKYITATVGWIFTLYISWCIAEIILRRLHVFKRRIFPTLLVSCLAIMGISYGIETAAINIGWWQWNIDHQTLRYLFIGGYSLFTLEAWSLFTTVFLAAFFLMEGSKFRRARGKVVFAILPFVYSWVILWIGPLVPSSFQEIICLTVFFVFPLAFLAFFHRIQFEYGIIHDGNKRGQKSRPIMAAIPLMMLSFMLSIILLIDIVVLKNPVLVISAMPLIFMLLLSIEKVPLYTVVIISFICLFLGREKMIVPTLPVMVVLIFWLVDMSTGFIHQKRLGGMNNTMNCNPSCYVHAPGRRK